MSKIENLFRNKVVYKILAFLLHHQDQEYFIRELARQIEEDPGNVQREVKKLEGNGLLQLQSKGKHIYVRLNQSDSDVTKLKVLFAGVQIGKIRFVAMGEEDNMNFLTTLYNIHGFVDPRAVTEGIIDHIVPSFFTIEDGLMKYWVPEDDWRETGKRIRGRLLRQEIDVERIARIYTAYGDEIIKLYQEVKELSHCAPEVVLAYITRFRGIMSHIMSYAWLALVDLRYYVHSNYIKQYIERRRKELGEKDTTAAVILERLLQPDRLTFTQRIRLLLLTLAQKEKRGDKVDREVELQRVHDLYRWLNFGWHGPESSYEFFVQTYQALENKSLQEIEEEILLLTHIDDQVKEEKEKLYARLQMDTKHKYYIESVALLSWLKVYRKDVLFCINWMVFHLLESYREKAGWSVQELAYITIDEVPDFLEGKLNLTKQDFRDRFHLSVLVGGEPHAYVGERAKQYLSQFELVRDKGPGQNIRLLNGVTACLGKTGDWIYGPAKIINTPADMKKMQPGDVLISVATTPDILPAMRQASALVTDQGGITSHAAIVSRELNLPCLIGTQYATKVFKDGDQIVMCPRHAYVRFQ